MLTHSGGVSTCRRSSPEPRRTAPRLSSAVPCGVSRRERFRCCAQDYSRQLRREQDDEYQAALEADRAAEAARAKAVAQQEAAAQAAADEEARLRCGRETPVTLMASLSHNPEAVTLSGRAQS